MAGISRRKKVPMPEPPGHLQRSTSWAGLRRGDPIEIIGPGLGSASWTFVAHVANTETGEESIEVVGGKSGEHKIRSFRPDQVFPHTGRRPRGGPSPSLADAPQLPFG